jgi:mRNA-degrading endonuclease RelE of RelBE toxin-antitoxin system
MKNEIYIASRLAQTLSSLSKDQQDRVASLIDSLNGDGLKNSEVLATDKSQGGDIRAAFLGGLSLIFRYVPEQHAIIVTDVTEMHGQPLATAARQTAPVAS